MEGTGSMLVSAGAVYHYVKYNPGVPRRTNRNCSWSLAAHQLSLDSTITVHKLPVP